jgi:modulator of FtsH protease
MFNPQSPYGGGGFGGRGGFGRGAFGSRYQYQTAPAGYAGVQSSSLISKVMGLLAFSFLFAFIGTIVGFNIVVQSIGLYWIIAIAGLVVLFILNFAINVRGWNLFLLYLFTFLEGMALSPIVYIYLNAGSVYSNILGEAFLITAITSLALAVYAWTTKRDFTRLGDYLFFGLILLIVTSLIGLFFGGLTTGPLGLIIAFFGVAIFSGFVLYYVQRAKYLADTLPNAIGLTVSLFITVLNLFLYILRILTILQGGNRR